MAELTPGLQFGPSSWIEIPQEKINAFADATGDEQWIHVDPERAAQGPFGTTIGHGYLTLSLLPVMSYEVVPRQDGGMAVPPAMGTAIGINFQPTGSGKSAITGDFVLLASEVNPVLHALRQNGIEVTALHNHMLDDQPRTSFVHFWANDDAAKLAQGLRAALDRVNIAKS